MPTILTPDALREVDSLIVNSRRQISEIYREWKAGVDIQTMALERGHEDLKKVKENLSALRVLFGRETLPKRGSGRQKAINEASFWLNSDSYLSIEVQEHFEKILLKAEKTNTRRSDSYEPILPPKNVYKQSYENKQFGDKAGIYILTKKSLQDQSKDDKTLIKIGWSNNVWDRISGAQTFDPDPLVILRVFPCQNPNFLEAKFHICLDTLGLAYDGGGGKEWFYSDLSLIDEIAKSLGLEHKDYSE